jgi:hypothetical protein
MNLMVMQWLMKGGSMHVSFFIQFVVQWPPRRLWQSPTIISFFPATPWGSNANAAHGRSQYNRLCEDIRHSLASKSDTRKWPRGDYETISEADDIKTAMVDDRHWARMHVCRLHLYFILFFQSQPTFWIAGQDKHGSKVYSWASVSYCSIVILFYGANSLPFP